MTCGGARPGRCGSRTDRCGSRGTSATYVMSANLRPTHAAIAAALLVGLTGTSCSDADPAGPAPLPDGGEVFLDGFAVGVGYQAFAGSKVDALDIDQTGGRAGTPSLIFTVPLPNDPVGSFAGGAFVNFPSRNLSGYNALSFWVRARHAARLDVVGFGNDNTGTSRYTAEASDVVVSTTWQQVVLPLPDPSRLTGEGGLFHLAEGAEDNQGNEIWIDDLRFAVVGTIADPRPAIPTTRIAGQPGGTARVTGTRVTYDVGGANRVINASPSYFNYGTSDPAVVTVDADGVMTFHGLGTATVTATLGSMAASGAVTVTVGRAPAAPPASPTDAAADVISLFSDAYDDVAVDTWSAIWDDADVEDVAVAGDAAKLYTNLTFAGIEFTAPTVDASAMTHFRMDIWTPDETANGAFLVKLVDFGANGAFGGGDDVEHELAVTAAGGLATQRWVRLDLPLADFAGLSSRGHLAQLIISGDPTTVYVDNVYFRRGAAPPPPPPTGAPTEPAPTPSHAAADVISLFSDAYDDVTVDTWSAEWDDAGLEDVRIEGDAVKKYTALSFAGIDFSSQTVNASEMTHFRMDIWTPDDTEAPAAFKVKLVDFGTNGVYDEDGDDTEHEVAVTAAEGLATGTWVQLDLPLAAFTGLAERGHVAQFIISGDPNTVYVDNVYFWR